MKLEGHDETQVESPAWHEDVLRDRDEKIKFGAEKFMDWEAAKKQLRDKAGQKKL